MNYLQKQAALQKLAQVRLAINYVMRNRGMKKQAEPGPGEKGWIDPQWRWMREYDNAAFNSPNYATWTTNRGGKPFSAINITSGHHFGDIPERLSKLVGEEGYLSPDDPEVQYKIGTMGDNYNNGSLDKELHYRPYIDIFKWKNDTDQFNNLPAWGIDSIMNANTPFEKVRQGQNWIFNQREPGYKPTIRGNSKY